MAAAAACALGLAGVVARQDVSTAPNALAQFYGPGGPVYGASAAGEQVSIDRFCGWRAGRAFSRPAHAFVIFPAPVDCTVACLLS